LFIYVHLEFLFVKEFQCPLLIGEEEKEESKKAKAWIGNNSKKIGIYIGLSSYHDIVI
jgi:hypothetical protein